ncbi:hypothetical protein CN13_09180 [Petrotoga sp. HKA.pet.4.5]|uniref:hypothetical protein n=1 Tax=unclassified Petrotoga TaxID=2620614 RepID=UPI000EF16D9A|nr:MULTISPECIES: hypothetical protein [unclassified Petrotoga]RLL86343.1 hypothetical protein BZ25_01545 [Petrotoga sp. Shatin.DS.tank11.9.2.9.3]RLL88014.1 hypothetical protein CN13_09180 [Petrotoga sp. HKA.pet.4.5]
MALIENRLNISKSFLKNGEINETTIDDVELRYFTTLLDKGFKKNNYISPITTMASESKMQGRVASKVS